MGPTNDVAGPVSPVSVKQDQENEAIQVISILVQRVFPEYNTGGYYFDT